MNKYLLILIALIDALVIATVLLLKGTLSNELLIGLLIFASLFTLRLISNQIIITNGNNKKN